MQKMDNTLNKLEEIKKNVGFLDEFLNKFTNENLVLLKRIELHNTYADFDKFNKKLSKFLYDYMEENKKC